MGWRLHYFALEITAGEPVRHVFDCATRAEEGARIIGRLACGAVAFQQWGNPDTGEWEAPDVLLTIGCVPSAALAGPVDVAA